MVGQIQNHCSWLRAARDCIANAANTAAGLSHTRLAVCASSCRARADLAHGDAAVSALLFGCLWPAGWRSVLKVALLAKAERGMCYRGLDDGCGAESTTLLLFVGWRPCWWARWCPSRNLTEVEFLVRLAIEASDVCPDLGVRFCKGFVLIDALRRLPHGAVKLASLPRLPWCRCRQVIL